ncbi:agamous-like MADS-box protein AP3 [Lactuca sativa]|uniref:agamous-like MADS-box protein AP3 n=1 Tax=Lactuca sativa TaxID=4236 RepID=UPI000CD8C489|nr:agamous-like MADS-box protein AP3 [Lactuca sativa]
MHRVVIKRFKAMAPPKVPMEFINDVKKRNLTFETRKQGIIKKANELATLCDVDIAMIICANDHQKPEIFSPDADTFNSLVNRYVQNRSIAPEKNRCYGLSDYFNDTKIKMEKELLNAKKNNIEEKFPTWFDFLDNLSEIELRELASSMEAKISFVKNKIESMKKNSGIQPNTVFTEGQRSMASPSVNNSPIMTVMERDDDDTDTFNQQTSKKPEVFYHWL